MATISNMRELRDLYAELADIERQQEDKTLPHSDQQLLDQAWEEVTNHIDELEEMIASEHREDEDQWRDAAAYLEEEDDSRPPTPRPAEPVRIAPPPPASVTLKSGISRDGRIVAQMPDGRWVPAPFPSFAPAPPKLSATWRPPPIEIPKDFVPTMAPPPPRPGGVSICNCDADGQCAYCEEEELERWNKMVDDREGCARCSGCHYCSSGAGYDGADEI